MIADACIYKPVRVAPRLGITGQVLHALVPRIAQIVMNTSFRMFPDSSAAKGAGPGAAVGGGGGDAADDAGDSFLGRPAADRSYRLPADFPRQASGVPCHASFRS
jgi:hypothetical protein